jgi:hypothetical protein
MKIRLAIVALAWPLLPLGAQTALQVSPGTRLRVSVSSPGLSVQTGSYRELTDSTLVLARGESVDSIPLARITRAELSRGKKPNVIGGVVGFLLGGAAGGVLACAANRDDYGVFCGGQNDTKLMVGAALGGAAGAAVGALLFRRERWTRVELVSPESSRTSGARTDRR